MQNSNKNKWQGLTGLRLRITLLQKSFSGRRGRLLLYFSLIASLFLGAGLIQHWFVSYQVNKTTDQELASWAAEISRQIAYKDKWDLAGYRNAAILAPSWYIVSRDGFVVDIEGKILPGMFDRVEMTYDSIYGSPQTIVSGIGETWRLLGKKVEGGSVIVGIPAPTNIREADAKLLLNISLFGSTLKRAAATAPRVINDEVHYAVLSSDGELKSAFGEIPLKILSQSPFFNRKATETAIDNGKLYRIYSEPVLDINNKPVGSIIVPKDMTLEIQAMRSQDLFNTILVLISLGLAVGITVWFSAREFLRHQNSLPVEEALRVGESKTVEFKSVYRYDRKLQQQNDELRLGVLKSIAGFLNSDGGTLYIGVEEDKSGHLSIRGIEDELMLSRNSKDELHLDLRNLITTRIGSEFSPFITDRIEEVQNKPCWIVTVDRSPEPAFVRWRAKGEVKEHKKFYVREGPRTSDLDNEGTWRYIRNKWG